MLYILTPLSVCLIYCLVYFADKPEALQDKTISE